MTTRRGREQREIVREAFRRATGDVEADVSRAVDALPAMMAEARRRRAREASIGGFSAVVPVARRAIPALAATACALAVVATLVGYRDASGTVDRTVHLDRLILTGELSDDVSDVLLEAVTDEGNDNG